MSTFTSYIVDKAVHARKLVMASFDPRERTVEAEKVEKLPLRRFNPTLRKFLEVAMPTDLQRLQKHRSNMEKYVQSGAWKELNIEQINASRTVQQLNATIRELNNIRDKIMDCDLEAFDNQVNPVKEQVIEAVLSFGNLQQNLDAKIEQADESPLDGASDDSACQSSSHQSSSNTPSTNETTDVAGPSNETQPASTQMQSQQMIDEEESMASASWDQLRQGLFSLQGIINDFACMIQQQQENVDSISDNVESAQHSVRSATLNLGQVSKLKAAVIPVAGAIVGGIVGGPIGLMAGFKLAGLAAAAGGGFIGYQGARFAKKKHDEKVDDQLTHLSSSDDTEMDQLKTD